MPFNNPRNNHLCPRGWVDALTTGQPQMATPISQIPQKLINDAKEDNNQIVNEILSEIENIHLQEAPEDTQGGNVVNFQRHMDEEIHNQD